MCVSLFCFWYLAKQIQVYTFPLHHPIYVFVKIICSNFFVTIFMTIFVTLVVVRLCSYCMWFLLAGIYYILLMILPFFWFSLIFPCVIVYIATSVVIFFSFFSFFVIQLKKNTNFVSFVLIITSMTWYKRNGHASF